MRPLDELEQDVLARIQGVVFDIDDTVTRGGRLERPAFDAMWKLHDAGIVLVAVTGRPLGWVDVVAKMWPVALAVGENGAGWSWTKDGRLLEGYFASESDRGAHEALFERVRAAVHAEMPEVSISVDDRARRADLAFDVGEHAQLSRGEIARLVQIIEREGATSSVSSVHAHASPGQWNKASGLVRALADVLGIDLKTQLDRWVFIGDSGNDEAAFGFFPISVGVANVREHVDRLAHPPKFVTTSDRGRGFAELANLLLGARTR